MRYTSIKKISIPFVRLALKDIEIKKEKKMLFYEEQILFLFKKGLFATNENGCLIENVSKLLNISIVSTYTFINELIYSGLLERKEGFFYVQDNSKKIYELSSRKKKTEEIIYSRELNKIFLQQRLVEAVGGTIKEMNGIKANLYELEYFIKIDKDKIKKLLHTICESSGEVLVSVEAMSLNYSRVRDIVVEMEITLEYEYDSTEKLSHLIAIDTENKCPFPQEYKENLCKRYKIDKSKPPYIQ